MNKSRILKEIIIVFILSILVLLIFSIKTYIYTSKPFDYIENAIVSMYDEDNKKTLKNFEKAYLGNDVDIYQVINGLADDEVISSFYKDKEEKSSGYAEYRKAQFLLYSNKTGEAIEELKKAANQNNIDALYFLGNYLYLSKRFTEAFEYIEKSYNLKDYRVVERYLEMKNSIAVYERMEELEFKYNKNTITKEEKLELGNFYIDKTFINDAYKILKPFIEENNKDALFAKANYIELEGDNDKALQIYKELFLKYKEARVALKVVQNSDISTKSNRTKLIKLLDEVKTYDRNLDFIKANLLFENDEWKEAKEIYDRLKNLKFIPVYKKLGKYYENIGDTMQAIEMYKLSFENGDIDSAVNLNNLVQDLQSVFATPITEDYTNYLKLASKLGSSEASYKLANNLTDTYEKKKYAIIALSQENVKALTILIDLAGNSKDKEKIRVYTNILINNK
ncbi:tetratricopeptide repeat protein [Pseudostreptobacillus hongkongensis]|uniref:tetratricopeptide repeat protein n=1 Tax=Pseudostreptobacillus hongkongensis TaxID=1162717 RepID=UPI00082EC8E1|nr:hypothetical protein [Pseudostreptobacillus hongkongensis]